MLFLGVDGGQSSTKALIADEHGNIVGTGTAGPCNHVSTQSEGRRKLARTVLDCVERALRPLELHAQDVSFESACFGMSGGPDDKDQILRETLSARVVVVTHDADVALAGATAGQPGVVVIAGTGSIVFGRGVQREQARAGGWGYVFGDAGGAFDIVRQAVRAMLREHEGWGPATALTERLLKATRTADANQMLHLFYTPDWPRSRVAELSVLVDQAAAAGDEVSREILADAAKQLCEPAVSVAARLFELGTTVPVATVGGVFRSAYLHDRFKRECESRPGLKVISPIFPPDAGALLEAFRASGRTVELRGMTGGGRSC